MSRYNVGKTITIHHDHLVVELGKGKVAIVDLDDLQTVLLCNWSLGKNGYVMGKLNGEKVYLHHLLYPNEEAVLFMNHDHLDLRRSNLRPCTHSQRHAHQRPVGNRKYKGCYLQGDRWIALIKDKGKTRYLGRYDSEVEAARAYDEAAKEQYGELAYLNMREE